MVELANASYFRHQKSIVASLKDPDISIRRRALDLLFAMCSPANAAEIVAELLSYLEVPKCLSMLLARSASLICKLTWDMRHEIGDLQKKEKHNIGHGLNPVCYGANHLWHVVQTARYGRAEKWNVVRKLQATEGWQLSSAEY